MALDAVCDGQCGGLFEYYFCDPLDCWSVEEKEKKEGS
jgi:hypothetical protein